MRDYLRYRCIFRGLTVVDEADKDQCKQVIYPAAVLKITKNKEKALAFLDYLTTDDCGRYLRAWDFLW